MKPEDQEAWDNPTEIDPEMMKENEHKLRQVWDKTTPVPGLSALTAVISNTCRENRGDEGAIDEALARARAVMVDTLSRWPRNKGATFFLTFTVDREGRTELY